MEANRVAKAAQKAGVEYHKKVTENKKAIKDGLPLPHFQIQELADPALLDPALRFLDELVQGQILRDLQQDFMPFEEEKSEGGKSDLDLGSSCILFELSYGKGRL
jgi:hypothetical protein